MTFSVNNPRGW